MEHYWTLVNNDNSNNFTTTTSNSVRGHYGNCDNNNSNLLGTNGTLANSDSAFHALMLGKRQYLEGLHVAAAAAKRGRSSPKCQVEGCEVVLGINNAKEYHRRHKVCEVHAKAPRVVVLGIQQRFCQQCSRFHGVEEFDESKRSCRRRLAGHNERRRKQSSQDHNHSLIPMKPGKLSSSECAFSLLSSSTNDRNYYPNWCNIKLTSSPSPAADLTARCGAALRELIAENRASNLASRQLINTNRPVAEDFNGGSNHQLAFIEHGTGNRVGRELDFETDQGS